MELKHVRAGETSRPYMLLIVPYGIETFLCGLYIRVAGLLIVPYGIETPVLQAGK